MLEIDASSGFSVTTGTTMGGPWLNNGVPIPVTLVLNLGSNSWIVGVVDGSLVKMVKIEITGTNTFEWKETRYTSDKSTCSNAITFSEECFSNAYNPDGNNYPVTLVTGESV